MKKKNHKNSIR